MNNPVCNGLNGPGSSPPAGEGQRRWDWIALLSSLSQQMDDLGQAPDAADLLWQDLMRPHGLRPSGLALDLRVPHSRITEILDTRKRRGISADTALRLEQFFAIPARVWLILQMERDLRTARAEAGLPSPRGLPVLPSGTEGEIE